MSFDLAAMARRNPRRRRNRDAVTLREIEPTQALENELRAIVVRPVNHWGAAAREVLLPLYEREMQGLSTIRDDATDRLREALDALEGEAGRMVLSLGPAISQWALRVERWHAERWGQRVQAATGLDISSLVRNLSAEPEVRAFQEWASGLIRNVSEDMQRRVETATFQAVAAQRPRRELASEIAEAMRIGRGRAKFIAQDQANKLSGKLDELRHREAGIDRYRWETAKDSRVRRTHRANQGKVFRWDKPPRGTGHPRTEPRCRCSALAWLPLTEGVDPARREPDIPAWQ